MFGRKRETELCEFCDRAIRREQKVCACGQATRYMDFEDRTQYEVAQWRAYRSATAS